MLEATTPPTVTDALRLRGVKFVRDAGAMGTAMASGSTELALAPMRWSETAQRVRRRLRVQNPVEGMRIKGRRYALNGASDPEQVATSLVTNFFEPDADQKVFISDLAYGLEVVQVGVAGGIGGGIGVRLESLPHNFNPFMHSDRGLCTGTIVVAGVPMKAELFDRKEAAWNIYTLPEDYVQMWPGNHNFLGQRPLRHIHGDLWQGHRSRFIINALRETL